MTFSQRVLATGVGPNSIIVIGSGILDQLGIRPADDIDLVVTKQLFDELEKSDKFSKSLEYGSYVLKNDDLGLEIWTEWSGDDHHTLFANSIELQDVRYVSLDYLKRWKKAKGRPKDLKDIELIVEYERKRS